MNTPMDTNIDYIGLKYRVHSQIDIDISSD
nr:MAG TPA: hypothetical protein [Crassvirales sp.]DAO10551.1 MAG TPA: hypothetical protein [Bacteriophage sp.]